MSETHRNKIAEDTQWCTRMYEWRTMSRIQRCVMDPVQIGGVHLSLAFAKWIPPASPTLLGTLHTVPMTCKVNCGSVCSPQSGPYFPLPFLQLSKYCPYRRYVLWMRISFLYREIEHYRDSISIKYIQINIDEIWMFRISRSQKNSLLTPRNRRNKRLFE